MSPSSVDNGESRDIKGEALSLECTLFVRRTRNNPRLVCVIRAINCRPVVLHVGYTWPTVYRQVDERTRNNWE